MAKLTGGQTQVAALVTVVILIGMRKQSKLGEQDKNGQQCKQ